MSSDSQDLMKKRCFYFGLLSRSVVYIRYILFAVYLSQRLASDVCVYFENTDYSDGIIRSSIVMTDDLFARNL